MAEANENLNGTINTPQGTDNKPADTQQSQEPAWLKELPEQHREDAKKSYLLQADYSRKTQEIAEKQKSWEKERGELEARVKEYNEFSQAYTPFYTKLQQHWDKIAPILEGRQAPAAQSQTHEDFFENYDVLPPQEQAKRLAEHVNNQYVTAQMAQLKQEFNQALAQREQYYSNYLNILTDAFERGRKDPNLNLPEYMSKAIQIQYGRENPLELAYTAVTADRTRKDLEEQFYKKGKEDALLEMQNKQQANGAMQSQTIPIFKQKPLTREQVSEAARQVAIGKGLPW